MYSITIFVARNSAKKTEEYYRIKKTEEYYRILQVPDTWFFE